MAATADMILSKSEAFKDPPNLQSIPIRKEHNFQFTRSWFQHRNQATFSTFLLPKFDGSFPIKILQIGVFEGADLVWQMQNTGKHPDSCALGVDPWAMTTKLDSGFMEGVYQRAKHNLKPYGVHLIRGWSENIIAYLGNEYVVDDLFDLIIVDGDHRAEPVYIDAINSLRLCKSGGWIVFDDVRNRIKKKDHVKEGLERFLNNYGKDVDQVWSHRFCECFEKI